LGTSEARRCCQRTPSRHVRLIRLPPTPRSPRPTRLGRSQVGRQAASWAVWGPVGRRERAGGGGCAATSPEAAAAPSTGWRAAGAVLQAVTPACDAGHELPLLHTLYDGRHTVVALSTGMAKLAASLIQAYNDTAQLPSDVAALPAALPAPPGAAEARGPPQPIRVLVADASSLDEFAPAAAVLSVFGLQQMGPAAPQVGCGARPSNTGRPACRCAAARLDHTSGCQGCQACMRRAVCLRHGPRGPSHRADPGLMRALAPGGVKVVVLWPSRVEPHGPWAALDQAAFRLGMRSSARLVARVQEGRTGAC
jgi:hypothetical protein